MDTQTDLSTLSDAELARMEKDIARKYIGGMPWMMVVWGLGNLAIWLSLWPLVMLGYMPLWLGFIIATVNVTLCYLPSHEAQHSNIAKPGTKWRWLNELVGYVSTIPLVFPYRVLRLTHMKHHAHTNDPEDDPDYDNRADGWLDCIWNTIKRKQPGYKDRYGMALEKMGDTPEVRAAVLEAVIWRLGHIAILCALAWGGYPLEAFFLWFLPKHLGSIYILAFLSWLPHHPFAEKGRYRDTRAWRMGSGFGIWNVITLGMQYHTVHHLHPAIPLFRNGPAYWEMRDVLMARGLRNDGL